MSNIVTKHNEYQIVTAWAESASGPGWANQPVWVLVRERCGKLRIECLQPDEQSRDIHTLYRVSSAAHGAMVTAVQRAAPDSAIRERFTLTCATCGVLYLPRPDETIHPINRCRACATKEAESAA